MPPSQLKRLKASLRDQGITGPQKSKKQKKNAPISNDRKLRRSTIVEGIREQFNPFDVKRNPRGPKFQVTTSRPDDVNGVKGRPGVARALGEERRRDTLLVEMQRRNKVGGIIDRRFGENDPTMSAEDKMLERFAREKQSLFNKKRSAFDLDDADEGLPEDDLPPFGNRPMDDFHEDIPEEEDDDSDHAGIGLKRSHADFLDDEEGGEQDPDRKKSKAEVMKEVIAKSKLHKYERQAAKEADDDLVDELDKEFSELQGLLLGSGAAKPGKTKETTINGVDKENFDRDYDVSVRKLIQDKRAQPTERTKTEDEKVTEDAEKLKELESKRLRRMEGEQVSDDEDEDADDYHEPAGMDLGLGNRIQPTATELGFDDEDDFIIDRDLVASDSELSLVSDDESDGESEGSKAEGDEDVGRDNESEGSKSDNIVDEFHASIPTRSDANPNAISTSDRIPFTFPCPQNHREFLDIIQDIPTHKVATVVQRIRALYHPKLASQNKELSAGFARVLIQHIDWLGDDSPNPPFELVESLTRHVHSLAKSYSVEISREFRTRIQDMSEDRPLSLTGGDLLLLTAVGTIFPTSDHFHQVVTPALIVMSRYLGQKIPQNLSDYATGLYLATLTCQYHSFSKRYVPEVLNFCLNTLSALSPVPYTPREHLSFPIHEPREGIRIPTEMIHPAPIRPLKFSDCAPIGANSPSSPISSTETSVIYNTLKFSLLQTALCILTELITLWSPKPAYPETFSPLPPLLSHLLSKPCTPHLHPNLTKSLKHLSTKVLNPSISSSLKTRKLLLLHNHRPLAIRTLVPKFEHDNFDPTKHYDPDKDRAEANRLHAEHKREKKGAMRELRRDAHFMAREKLKAKKVRDDAYEKKFGRLVAGIQGEEGREAKEYERERRKRKSEKERAKGRR